MFRPETYEIVRRHQTIGVNATHRKRFAELRKGDKFLAYISQHRVLDGHGVLTSDPFEDHSPLFDGTGKYPNRSRVQFDEIGLATDARELLWGIQHFTLMTMKTLPTNYLRCYGGFMSLTKQDYEWLLNEMKNRPICRFGEPA